MDDSRFGRAGRPGSRLRVAPADPLDALGSLFGEPPVGPSPTPAMAPGGPPGAGRGAAGQPPPAAPEPGDPAPLPRRDPAFDQDDAPGSPAPPLRLWWDDPRDRRPLPDRPHARPSENWPRPVIPPGAPPPPYAGCRWPRACAVLGKRLPCLSSLPCRCPGGDLLAREAAIARGGDA